MKFFVTGATGFLGGALSRQLLELGHEVHALVRDRGRAASLAGDGLELFEGDVAVRESLYPGMRHVDGVFHVAGWYKLGARSQHEAHRVNVEGTRNVLEVMRDLDIPRAVYTSTLAVFSDTRGRLVDESYFYDGPHITEYDRTKWLAHYQVALPLMRSGLPLIVVQPGLIYGPGDHSGVHDTFVRFLRRRLPAVPKRTAYCWAHVDDIAYAHILAMQKGSPGETYIIAGPPYTLEEVISLASDVTRIPSPRLRLDPGVLKAAAGLMSLAEKWFPVPVDLTSDTLRSTAGVTYLGSNAKAVRELDYHPRRLEEWLPETLLWEAEQLNRAASQRTGKAAQR